MTTCTSMSLRGVTFGSRKAILRCRLRLTCPRGGRGRYVWLRKAGFCHPSDSRHECCSALPHDRLGNQCTCRACHTATQRPRPSSPSAPARFMCAHCRRCRAGVYRECRLWHSLPALDSSGCGRCFRRASDRARLWHNWHNRRGWHKYRRQRSGRWRRCHCLWRPWDCPRRCRGDRWRWSRGYVCIAGCGRNLADELPEISARPR